MDPENSKTEMPPADSEAEKIKPKPKGKGKCKAKGKAKSKVGKRSKVAEVEGPTEEVVLSGANDCEDPAEEVLPSGANDCEDPAAETLLAGASGDGKDGEMAKRPNAKGKAKAGAGKRKNEFVDKAGPEDAGPVKKPRAGDAKCPTTFARRYMPAKPGFSRERWQAIRIAFNKNIHKKLEWPSKHEDFNSNVIRGCDSQLLLCMC